jgi:hypothetical protein
MSDFDRVRPAISHYEQLARNAHGINFVPAATAQFSDMQQKYYSAVDNPDYGSIVKQFCYLYKYSVPHGYYIYVALKQLRAKIRPSIFSRNPTRIACVGGGPGTEIIGLSRYFREIEAENIGNQVEVTIFDKELSWEKACSQVLNCVSPGINIKLTFVQFDATDPTTYQNLNFSGFHLVMANFFASEIRKAKIVGASRAFWQHMFGSMGAGKVFLAVDFADTDGKGWQYIESIIPPSATSVLSHSEIGMSCPDSKASILILEAELDHRPKKNAKNFIKAVIT